MEHGVDSLSGGVAAAGGWNDCDVCYFKNTNGTDDHGFSAMPGGWRYDVNFEGYYNHPDSQRWGGRFHVAGYTGCWWTATETDTYGAYHWYMSYDNLGTYPQSSDKGHAYSVRCVKND